MTNWETVKALVESLNKLLIDKGGESYGFPLGEVPDTLYQLLADAIDKSEIYSHEEFLPYFEQVIGTAGEWDYQKLSDKKYIQLQGLEKISVIQKKYKTVKRKIARNKRDLENLKLLVVSIY